MSEVDSDDDSVTSSSGDETFSDVGGLHGYQFEPRRTHAHGSNDPSSSDDEASDNDTVPARARKEDTTWCKCGNCSIEWLKRDKECLCCLEHEPSRSLARPATQGGRQCVTNNADYQTLCLSNVVLRNVLVSLNNIRGDYWNVNPPSNRSYRYAAYRQYTWWSHGKLGVKQRHVIPACGTHHIRSTFPKRPDEEYEGFHSGEEDDQ